MEKNFLKILFVFAFFSCQKEVINNINNYNSITNSGIEQDFINFLNEDVEGNITISSSHNFNHSNYMQARRNIAVYAGFKMETINSLLFNALSVEKTEDYFHYFTLNQNPDIYGDILSIEISEDFPATSLYLPERIFGFFNHATLSPGDTVMWNADPLNDKGVIVALRYTPVFQIPPIEGGGDDVINYALTNDVGYYILPNSLFDNFPSDSRITITLYRGNYERIYSIEGSEVVNFLGLTKSSSVFNY